MGTTRGKKGAVQAAVRWVTRQPSEVKMAMGVASAVAALVVMWFVVHDHETLFVAAEVCHAVGIAFLIYKLTKFHSCAGLSLKTQDLTAIFLAVRLYCSYVMEYDIHTILDSATLVSTLWVIYMMRYKLRSTYMEDKDTCNVLFLIIPCAFLALLVHPSTTNFVIHRILWAFCSFLEAVSVFPQLRAMQNTKIVEPFTAHYVFALGIARFFSFAFWILKVAETRGNVLVVLGGGLWPLFAIISEIVQTFILADFCYYYVKSAVGGDLVLRLPTGVV